MEIKKEKRMKFDKISIFVSKTSSIVPVKEASFKHKRKSLFSSFSLFSLDKNEKSNSQIQRKFSSFGAKSPNLESNQHNETVDSPRSNNSFIENISDASSVSSSYEIFENLKSFFGISSPCVERRQSDDVFSEIEKTAIQEIKPKVRSRRTTSVDANDVSNRNIIDLENPSEIKSSYSLGNFTKEKKIKKRGSFTTSPRLNIRPLFSPRTPASPTLNKSPRVPTSPTLKKSPVNKKINSPILNIFNSKSTSKNVDSILSKQLKISKKVSLAMMDIMKDGSKRNVFKEFSRYEYSSENLEFWENVQLFKSTDDVLERMVKAEEILTRFLSPDSEEEINITARTVLKTKTYLYGNMENGNCPTDTFDSVIFELECGPLSDTLSRFKLTKDYQKINRIEVLV
jgi:CRISPR/Cas system CMR-associated protein Cmr5 small subunit